MDHLAAGSFVSVLEIEDLRVQEGDEWRLGPPAMLLTGDEDDLDPNDEGEGSSSRRAYFSRRVRSALYHSTSRRSLHQDAQILELLSVPGSEGAHRPARHLLVIHGSLPSGSSDVPSIGKVINSVTDASARSLGVVPGLRRFRLVAAVVPKTTYRVDGFSDAAAMFDKDRALLAWQLANLRADQPPVGELARLEATTNLFEPNGDMTLLVHHDGAALVFEDSGPVPSDPFEAWQAQNVAEYSRSAYAQWHVHTVMTDALLLGMLQRSGINTLADQVGEAFSERPNVDTMRVLDESFSHFKTGVWARRISEEETGNVVLQAFQRKHGLPELVEEVSQGVAQYASQVQALSSALSSAAVTLLTLTLFPLTVVVALVTAITPATASFAVKLGAYLSTVPIALAFAFLVAWRIPNYLPFVRSLMKSRQR